MPVRPIDDSLMHMLASALFYGIFKTVRHADQILVLDGGKIAQRGTHAELCRQPGLYAAFLHARQEAVGWKIQ